MYNFSRWFSVGFSGCAALCGASAITKHDLEQRKNQFFNKKRNQQ
jgi:hypothetical protein